MNNRERLLAILNHQPPDRIPWIPRLELWYNARVNTGSLGAYSGMALRQVEKALRLGTPARDGRVYRVEYDGVEIVTSQQEGQTLTEYHTPLGSLRQVVVASRELADQGIQGLMKEHFLKTARDYKTLEWVFEHMRVIPTYEAYLAYDREIGEDGLPLMQMAFSPFWDFLEVFAGFDNAYYHLSDYHTEVEHLLNCMEEVYRERLWPVVADSPAQMILTDGHLSSQLTPPRLFERYLLPYHQDLSALLRSRGKCPVMHADADTSEDPGTHRTRRLGNGGMFCDRADGSDDPGTGQAGLGKPGDHLGRHPFGSAFPRHTRRRLPGGGARCVQSGRPWRRVQFRDRGQRHAGFPHRTGGLDQRIRGRTRQVSRIRSSKMKIHSISLFEISMKWQGLEILAEDRQVVPLDLYPQYNQGSSYSTKPGSILKNIFAEIIPDEGRSGIYGPIDDQQAFIIKSLLAPFLKEKDPLAVEALHDQMLRMHRHGRSGFFLTALSAVDLALWDLKGKAFNVPVFRLLGGPTRSAVPAYASMLGASTEPSLAAAKAEGMKTLGFPAQKWFFRYGPGSGQEGIEKNLAMAFAVREAVGAHYPLAFDAFNGWTEPYAVEMLAKLEPIQPWWVEEVIPPERAASLAKIRASSRVPLATGEHVYTRWQVKELLANGALDFLQTDPDWTGGITEQVKICHLASSYDIPVIAHGHSLLPALHIAAAQSPAVVPMVEYLTNFQPVKQAPLKTMLEPIHGADRAAHGSGPWVRN